MKGCLNLEPQISSASDDKRCRRRVQTLAEPENRIDDAADSHSGD